MSIATVVERHAVDQLPTVPPQSPEIVGGVCLADNMMR
jgi:hypothetical protein